MSVRIDPDSSSSMLLRRRRPDLNWRPEIANWTRTPPALWCIPKCMQGALLRRLFSYLQILRINQGRTGSAGSIECSPFETHDAVLVLRVGRPLRGWRHTRLMHGRPLDENLCRQLPHAEQLHVIERFKKSPDHKSLEDLITVDGPGAFTRPWSGIQRFKLEVRPLQESACAENNQDFFH